MGNFDKFKQVGKPENSFKLKLEFNGKLVSEKTFSADSFTPETIQETQWHYTLIDCVRFIEERLKKIDMDNLWKRHEKNNNTQKKNT